MSTSIGPAVNIRRNAIVLGAVLAVVLAILAFAPATTPAADAAKAGKYPSAIKKFTAKRGTKPGTIKLRWKLDGSVSKGLRVEAALSDFSPYGKKNVPRRGWNWKRFSFSGSTRTANLSVKKLKKMDAGLGSGRFLLLRTFNTGRHNGKKIKRWYGPLVVQQASGIAPSGLGSTLRVANFNVRMAGLDTGEYSWDNRVEHVAQTIQSRLPVLVGLNEFIPSDMGSSFATEMSKIGLDRYELTRTSNYGNGDPGGTRILYDTDVLSLVTSCSENEISCAIAMRSRPKRGKNYAPYGEFEVKATGERFWFVSAHLDVGKGEESEELREDQMKKIVKKMADIAGNDPVIFTGDVNSAQVSGYHYLPQGVLLDHGYYDAAAATTTIALDYDTANHFEEPRQTPNKRGFGARLDVIATRNMPGASLFENVLSSSADVYPSDHNMVIADVRLP